MTKQKFVLILFLLSLSISGFSQQKKFERDVESETCNCIALLPDSLNLSAEQQLDSCFSKSFATVVIDNDNYMPYVGVDNIRAGMERIKAALMADCKAINKN